MYVLGSDEQERLRARLEVEDSDGCTQRLRDPETGETWVLYQPHAEAHGGGPWFLRREPVPEEVVEWMRACLRSPRQVDAIGLGTDLAKRPEVWPAALSHLEASGANYLPGQVAAFLDHLGILRPINRRPVLGKPSGEIAADAAYFRDLAERARRLREGFRG